MERRVHVTAGSDGSTLARTVLCQRRGSLCSLRPVGRLLQPLEAVQNLLAVEVVGNPQLDLEVALRERHEQRPVDGIRGKGVLVLREEQRVQPRKDVVHRPRRRPLGAFCASRARLERADVADGELEDLGLVELLVGAVDELTALGHHLREQCQVVVDAIPPPLLNRIVRLVAVQARSLRSPVVRVRRAVHAHLIRKGGHGHSLCLRVCLDGADRPHSLLRWPLQPRLGRGRLCWRDGRIRRHRVRVCVRMHMLRVRQPVHVVVRAGVVPLAQLALKAVHCEIAHAPSARRRVPSKVRPWPKARRHL
eukprot:Opistho-1_new@21812